MQEDETFSNSIAVRCSRTHAFARAGLDRRVAHARAAGMASVSLRFGNAEARREWLQVLAHPPPLPPPSRTNWTRLVPPPVLIGRVSSLLSYRCSRRSRSGACGTAVRVSRSCGGTPPPPLPSY
jgi:hypothetical protein